LHGTHQAQQGNYQYGFNRFLHGTLLVICIRMSTAKAVFLIEFPHIFAQVDGVSACP
jgi:hypothetical protein